MLGRLYELLVELPLLIDELEVLGRLLYELLLDVLTLLLLLLEELDVVGRV